MLTLLVTFPTPRVITSAETVDLFTNLDGRGRAAGPINESAPANDSPLRLFPGQDPGPRWAAGPWGQDTWAGYSGAPAVQFETPPICFGRVRVAGKTRDEVGNYQTGPVAVADRVINSTPTPPARFRPAGYAAGRQTFTFIQSPQLKL